MSLHPLAHRVRFILCNPSHPGNIGSAARAIKTMGFRQLHVVNPREAGYRTHEEAVAYATSSVDVLAASQSYASLSEALDGVLFAWALTGYEREFGPQLVSLTQATEASCASLTTSSGDIAFVFGTERYEMHQCLGKASNAPALYDWQTRFETEPAASSRALDGFMQHWEAAMQACGVYDPTEPKVFMPTMRRLFTRARLTQNEVDLLRGVCAAIIRPKAQRKGTKVGPKS